MANSPSAARSLITGVTELKGGFWRCAGSSLTTWFAIGRKVPMRGGGNTRRVTVGTLRAVKDGGGSASFMMVFGEGI
jgi:hypothetical protein